MDFSQLLLLRVIERILAVLIGGFSIYLGYRLFIEMPYKNDSSGKVELPGDISIFFSRVGPGVFFSLFGAAVVAVSIYRGLEIDTSIAPAADKTENIPKVNIHYANPGVGEAESAKLASLRAGARVTIAELNKLPALLPADFPTTRLLDVTQAIRASKLALLETVWGKDWGEFAIFRNWVNEGAADPIPQGVSPEAVKNFRETRS